MKNQTSISESLKRLKKEFSGIHNVKSWGSEECDCVDDGTNKCFEKLEKAIRQELLALVKSYIKDLERLVEEPSITIFEDEKFIEYQDILDLIESWKSGVKK